ncbi:isochorismatase family protein [Bordetella sp. 02P26C-1]|uniref:isochorismatase family protein n=1 Tax=Bordetella sp. 02P26C-1 TaxID=2683195 RepID=UPI0013539026|nr:isochorismatase family protein [Bordetella sp. 02P26C-1]MVW78115.1 isochorismatase family protein [Bordetella sp. 02P26C-1]
MGQRMGFGHRPALLIIDFQNAFADENFFGGYNIGDAMANTERLLQTCRQTQTPVAHVRFATSNDGSDIGPFGMKVPRLKDLVDGDPAADIVAALTPLKNEFVSTKRHGSAFFGTNLHTWLTSKGVDTLLISGCATSGCVRASTVDASAYGYRPMVVVDCVGDRAQAPHESNLFDMGQKYADLVSLEEVQAYLAG